MSASETVVITNPNTTGLTWIEIGNAEHDVVQFSSLGDPPPVVYVAVGEDAPSGENDGIWAQGGVFRLESANTKVWAAFRPGASMVVIRGGAKLLKAY